MIQIKEKKNDDEESSRFDEKEDRKIFKMKNDKDNNLNEDNKVEKKEVKRKTRVDSIKLKKKKDKQNQNQKYNSNLIKTEKSNNKIKVSKKENVEYEERNNSFYENYRMYELSEENSSRNRSFSSEGICSSHSNINKNKNINKVKNNLTEDSHNSSELSSHDEEKKDGDIKEKKK